ncbi:Hypothetical predicted protein [Scomber scombrus]|uniref:Uncharacterized protein n=1 Tax=Scomber scombrus TaxID=13677 RepID=A0AAV1MTI1_SCOSC
MKYIKAQVHFCPATEKLRVNNSSEFILNYASFCLTLFIATFTHCTVLSVCLFCIHIHVCANAIASALMKARHDTPNCSNTKTKPQITTSSMAINNMNKCTRYRKRLLQHKPLFHIRYGKAPQKLNYGALYVGSLAAITG